MRSVIILFIQLYRRLIPLEKRKRCLFRESCSQHVERIAQEHGAWAALRAFLVRARRCRPGYGFEWSMDAETWRLVCADGSKIPAAMASAHVTAEYQVLKSLLSFSQLEEAADKKL